MEILGLFLLCFIHFGAASPNQKLYSLPDFEMCIETDLMRVEYLKKELFKIIPLEEITRDKKDTSFGLLNEDWDRLDRLAKNLPNDSVMKSRLVSAFRLLIAALYQAHSKPIFQECYSQSIAVSKDTYVNLSNKTYQNLGNRSSKISKNRYDLDEEESSNWPRETNILKQTAPKENDDTDNVVAGSNNEDTEMAYPLSPSTDSPSSVLVHNDDVTSRSPHLPTNEFIMYTKTPRPFDTNLIHDEFSSGSKEFHDEDDTGKPPVSSVSFEENPSTASYNSSLDVIHIQNTTIFQILYGLENATQRLLDKQTNDTADLFNVSKNVEYSTNATTKLSVDTQTSNNDYGTPEVISNISTSVGYHKNIDGVFESSSLPYLISTPDFSESQEKDPNQQTPNITVTPTEQRLPTSVIGETTTLSNTVNVAPFKYGSSEAQGPLDYESTKQSTTSLNQNFTSTFIPPSSEENTPDNMHTIYQTTVKSTLSYQDSSHNNSTFNVNMSDIFYNNGTSLVEEPTTSYPSYLFSTTMQASNETKESPGIEESDVKLDITDHLFSTTHAFSEVTRTSSTLPQSVKYGFGIDHSNDENDQSMKTPISEFTNENTSTDIFEITSSSEASKITSTTEASKITSTTEGSTITETRTISNIISNINTSNPFSEDNHDFPSTYRASLNPSSEIISDQTTPTSRTTKSEKTTLPYYFDNSLYDDDEDNNQSENPKGLSNDDHDTRFPESRFGLDTAFPEQESSTMAMPTESFKYFTITFKKLLDNYDVNKHTNKLKIYPKSPIQRPQHKVLSTCTNGNNCVQINNNKNHYPAPFYRIEKMSYSDNFNMPNHIIAGYKGPSKTPPKLFDTSNVQWWSKQKKLRKKS